MKEILKKFVEDFDSNLYIKTLHDPIQTHAIYGITKDRQKAAVEQLKALGATKFRMVGTNGFKVICFKAI
jgi:hypothetical protein